jgi:hypothetical protein
VRVYAFVISKKMSRVNKPLVSSRKPAQQAQRRASAPRSNLIPDIEMRGFGSSPPRDIKSLYMAGPTGSSTGAVTTHSELGLKVTDFFDYNVTDPNAGGIAQVVTNYFWNCRQNLFENGTSSGPFTDNELTFCRARKLEVYVLPAKGFDGQGTAGVNVNNAAGMFTVQCQVPGVTQRNVGGATEALATDTQVTNVLPQIDTMWKKVMTCDLQKTFQSGVIRPFFDDSGVNGNLQCLFQMAIVNSTDGSSYLPATDDENPLVIRVKVVVHVDQPIATIQNASLRVFSNESFALPSTAQNGTAFSNATLQYVQTDLGRVRNNMR